MRFFFAFASCCGPACRSAVITTAAKPAEERLGPLYAASVPVNSRRRQNNRWFASRSGSSGDWRPALHAISEDIVVVEREAVGGSDMNRKKRKVTQSQRKVQVRNYNNNDYRYDHFNRRAPFGGGAMVPAFSPTPFFF